jgi:hypothetical protein
MEILLSIALLVISFVAISSCMEILWRFSLKKQRAELMQQEKVEELEKISLSTEI